MEVLNPVSDCFFLFQNPCSYTYVCQLSCLPGSSFFLGCAAEMSGWYRRFWRARSKRWSKATGQEVGGEVVEMKFLWGYRMSMNGQNMCWSRGKILSADEENECACWIADSLTLPSVVCTWPALLRPCLFAHRGSSCSAYLLFLPLFISFKHIFTLVSLDSEIRSLQSRQKMKKICRDPAPTNWQTCSLHISLLLSISNCDWLVILVYWTWNVFTLQSP